MQGICECLNSNKWKNKQQNDFLAMLVSVSSCCSVTLSLDPKAPPTASERHIFVRIMALKTQGNLGAGGKFVLNVK